MVDAPGRAKLAAWAVHAFTASGVVLAFLSLLAVERGAWADALLWLLVALVVDGIDGTFARAARVREILPQIDGDALDLVIDYLTYVFVPALFLWRADYLPKGWELPLVAAMLVSSLYTFARRDMKTDDGYFRGFPALWNIIAFYFFVANPGPVVGAVAVVALVIMTFAPVHVVHPFRVRDYGWGLPVAAIAWLVSTAALLLPVDRARFPLLAVSLATLTLMISMGLLRTIRGRREL